MFNQRTKYSSVATNWADPGESIEFEVVDSAGNPLTNYTINNHRPQQAEANRSIIYGFIEGQTRTVYLKDRVAKLGKAVTIDGVPKERQRQGVLESFGIVTARLVKKQGEPAMEAVIQVRQEPIAAPDGATNPAVTHVLGNFNADREGLFRYADLIPGGEYSFYVPRAGENTRSVFVPGRFTVQAGKTIDLGEINITTGEIVTE